MGFWLQFTFVLALALIAWISAIDTTGSPGLAPWLWAATALAGAHLVYRFLVRAR
jgi:hypothetical protein